MSLQHFFLGEQVIADEREQVFALRLTSEDHKHMKVLRLRPGEHIAVIDAAKDYFECEIASVSPEAVMVRIANRAEGGDRGVCEGGSAAEAGRSGAAGGVEPAGSVTLFQGIAKGDKMDAVIRQATELGVAGIVPLMCERSIVRLDGAKAEKRTARWRSIGKSASMQSGRRSLPDIALPMSVDEASAALAGFTAVIICWEESDGSCGIGKALRAACHADAAEDVCGAHIAVIVGPEGGLTPDEVDVLRASNRRSAIASLGSTILRTETAGVVASALALYELGGLGNTRP